MGILESGKIENIAIVEYGDLATLRCGIIGIWKYWDVKILDVDILGCENMELNTIRTWQLHRCAGTLRFRNIITIPFLIFLGYYQDWQPQC